MIDYGDGNGVDNYEEEGGDDVIVDDNDEHLIHFFMFLW